MDEKSKTRAIRSETITVVVFVGLLLVIAAVFAVLRPDTFLTGRNVKLLFKHMTITALVGLGLTFVIVVGFADMSFHFVSCLASMTMAYMIFRGVHPVAAVLIGCAAGLICGAINGVMVGLFKLPAMVATIGLGTIAWAAAHFYSHGSQIYDNFIASGAPLLSDGWLLGLPVPVIILIAAYATAYVVLHRSRFGRCFYATGSNPLAARFSGVHIQWYVIAAFVICGVLASLTNMIQDAAQQAGNIKGGLVLLMPAYASVFVGISVMRKPTVAGTFLGALLIALITNGFMLLDVKIYVITLITGIVLILAIVISKTDFRQLAGKFASLFAPAGEGQTS